MDVMGSSTFTACVLTALLAGCGPGPREIATTLPTSPPRAIEATWAAPRAPDPDLHRPPPHRALDIDWDKVTVTDDASALALWHRIAPTGADWEDKVHEIPSGPARPLAIALLRGGNVTCARP